MTTSLLTAVVTSSLAASGSVTVGAVLESVEKHHPLVDAARRDVDAARGKRLAAEGAFDLYVSAKGSGFAAGFYDGIRSEVEILQPTTAWGIELFGGYAFGEDHPIYDGKNLTSDYGELGVGMRLPLWRDRATDSRRTELIRAEAATRVSEMALSEKLLYLKLAAAIKYWKWVASHEKLEIAEGMLQLAEKRVVFIGRRVAEGQLAEIELIDNERLMLSRRGDLIAGRRQVQARAFELSLYLRKDDGAPLIPDAQSAPQDLGWPDHGPPTLDRVRMTTAFERRPETRRLAQEMVRAKAQLALARNENAPRLDVSVRATQDLGTVQSYGPDPKFATKNETEVMLGLSISLPVQRRKARGRAQMASAKLRALEAKQRFVVDKIETEIRDAASKLEAAQQRALLATKTLRFTKRVEAAERRKFELGKSNILTVNLREEATAKAAKALVDALTEYHIADAAIRAALFEL